MTEQTEPIKNFVNMGVPTASGLLLALILSVVPANAAVLTVSPTVDGYAWTYSAFSNIEANSLFLQTIQMGSLEYRSALEFDINGIPSGVVVGF